jgi:outer membrane protein
MKKTYLFKMLQIVLIVLAAAPAWAGGDSFEEILAGAYQNNPELDAARAKLRAADENVAVAMSGWRPNITATGVAGRSREKVSGNGVTPLDKTVSPNSVSLNVTQPVFSGGRTVAAVDSAEAAVKSQRAALADAEQKLLLNTGKAYLDVVQAEQVLSISKDIETALKKELEEVTDRLKVGDLKKTDHAQSRARLKSATVTRRQAERDLETSRSTFARLAGRMPGTLTQPKLSFELPESKGAAVGLALKGSPAVLAATWAVEGADADIRAARGALLPDLSLVGSASRARDQNIISPTRDDGIKIEARLTVPIYTGGEDYAKTRQAQQTAAQRLRELDDARNRAREQAEAAWEDLTAARDSKEGRADAAAAAEDALTGVKTEARYGTRTTLDVLNAEQELSEARVGLARAAHDELLAMMELKAAAGDLTARALHLPVKPYDPQKNYKKVRGKWIGFADTKSEFADTENK